jgi:hypothetical protein
VIGNVDDAHVAAFRALALARLIGQGMGNFTFATDGQRAVGDGMDLLILQLDEIRDWLDGWRQPAKSKGGGDKRSGAERIPHLIAVAAKVARKRTKK